MDEILCFKGYSFCYNAQQTPTLKDITLSVKKGERVVIAGPSGCGKSTLIHAINGLIPFSYRGTQTGSLTLFGKETKDMSLFEISSHVGTVLQDSDSQFVGLTVGEDIAFAAENDCIKDPELHDIVRRAAEMTGVFPLLSLAPKELSGGQKQRTALAGVLLYHTDILLFDEPLANLDPATGRQAIELIDDLQKKTGCAVIIVEHRLEDALHRGADRVVLMQAGRVIADETPDALLAKGILPPAGIREPLYVTCARYAGVNITSAMHPVRIEEFTPSAADLARVRDHYANRPPVRPVPERADILTARDLTFRYTEGRDDILRGVSLSIKKGELLAIVGKNGAGKSTLCKVICGFEEGARGDIRMHGEDFMPLSIRERAEKIGYVLQDPNHMISQTMIMDEVALGLRARGKDEAFIKEKTGQVLKLCGLWPMRNWPVACLSYGQKKRLTIASILALDPEILLLDEPTAGQDLKHYTDIMEFLSSLTRLGISVVMITHDMHLMLEYADRAIVFAGGRVIAEDVPAGILTNAAIVEQANLRLTSLYALARQCGASDPRDFIRRFIERDKEVRFGEA